jgi:hypothetical protein
MNSELITPEFSTAVAEARIVATASAEGKRKVRRIRGMMTIQSIDAMADFVGRAISIGTR